MEPCSLSSANGKISIYADYINITKKATQSEILDAAKCFLTNAHSACDAILKGRLTCLDPIVGENACQIRALQALNAYLDPQLKEEVKNLQTQAKLKLTHLQKRKNFLGTNKELGGYDSSIPLVNQIQALDLSLDVPERVYYLFKCHFLTIGKYFGMTREGRETCGIDCQTIKERLKTDINKILLEKIVHIAREKLSFATIQCIQEQRGLVSQLEDRYVREMHDHNYTFFSSCAFYNLKAVMLQILDKQLPILLKEHGSKNPLSFYFKSIEPGKMPILCHEVLEQNQAIFVIECFFPEHKNKDEIAKAIEGYGLLDMVLANVALVPQYSSDNDISCLDPASQQEIEKYKKLGEHLACHSANPHVFKIVHVHAATVKEERVKTA